MTRFSLKRLLKWICIICVVFALFGYLVHAVRDVRRAATRSASQSPLNQMSVALANYHSLHGHLPPAYIADDQGVPIHSWRVLILPFIEQHALYKAYRFDEPWDGPNNSKLANKMPSFFNVASEPFSEKFTNIVLVSGEGTAFPGAETRSFHEIADGSKNTILLTEIGNSKVPWMAPVDVDIETSSMRVNDPATLNISSVYWRRPHVVFADSIRAFAVPEDITPEQLKAFCTIAGGEEVSRADVFGGD